MRATTFISLCYHVCAPVLVLGSNRKHQQEQYDKIYTKTNSAGELIPQSEWGMAYDFSDFPSQEGKQPLDKVLPKYLKATDKILIIGGGISQLGVGLWKDGFKDITQIDVSEVAVSRAKVDHASFDGLKTVLQDATDMVDYQNNTFDVVLEKLTFDYLRFFGQDVVKASTESLRVLRHGGVFLSITNQDYEGAPASYARKAFGSDNCDWDDTLGTPEGSKLRFQFCKAFKTAEGSIDRSDL